MQLALNSRTVNPHYFEEWSDNMAYTLGFIWADGTIGTRGERNIYLRFRQHPRDRDILEKIRDDMKSKHKISDKPDICSLKISNSYIAEVLVCNYGVLPAKSELDLPYPVVPDAYFRHFARGYSDGDGTIGKQWEFLGSRRFIEGLQEQLCRLYDLPKLGIWPCDSAWRVGWGGMREKQILKEELYTLDSSHLAGERKRRKVEFI